MSDIFDKLDNSTQSGDIFDRLNASSTEYNPGINPLSSALGLGALGLGGYGVGRAGYGLAKGIGSTFGNLPKVFNSKEGSDFAKETRSAFVKAHTEKIDQFGKDLVKWQAKYPERSVDLSELVSDIQTNPDLSKQAISIFKKTPKLDNLLENPKLASSVPLKDAQDIVNHLNTKIPKNIRVNNFDVLSGINNIKQAQLEAFPEIAQTRADYAPFIENFNMVRGFFKPNKLLSAIVNKFGGAEGQQAVSEILPKEIMKKLKNYRAAVKLSEIPQDLPLVGRGLKSLGGMLGVAPTALQLFEIWKLRNDPEAQYNAMLGNPPLPPKGSLEREIQQGRVL